MAFDGTPASSVTYVSASQLQAALPSAATTGPITVTNTAAPTGTVRSRPSYTVTPFAAATVSSFSPPSGVTDAVISIEGTNLCGASSVKFGSHAARFSIVSPTADRQYDRPERSGVSADLGRHAGRDRG